MNKKQEISMSINHSSSRRVVTASIIACVAMNCFVSGWPCGAGAPVDSNVKGDGAADEDRTWSAFGDLRLRFESDWNSQREDGTARDDRDRLRTRARFGLEWKPNDIWSFKVRARTGSHLSQQSPHLTLHDFDGGDSDDFDGGLDLWYGKASFESDRHKTTFWVGRNEFPFDYALSSQELIWDKDATLTGGFVSTAFDLSRDVKFTLSGGAFALPEGLNRWSGALWGGQATLDLSPPQKEWDLFTGVTFLGLDGGGASDRYLDGNGERDYNIGIASLRARQSISPRHSLTLGFDWVHNFEGYSEDDSDPTTQDFHDAIDGWMLGAKIGTTEFTKQWDWEIEYAYGYIERLAVNSSFAQDDWVRWGRRGQTLSSDFRGHQISGKVRLWKGKCHHVDLQARSFFVDSVSSAEDGNRFRVDINYGINF